MKKKKALSDEERKLLHTAKLRMSEILSDHEDINLNGICSFEDWPRQEELHKEMFTENALWQFIALSERLRTFAKRDDLDTIWWADNFAASFTNQLEVDHFDEGVLLAAAALVGFKYDVLANGKTGLNIDRESQSGRVTRALRIALDHLPQKVHARREPLSRVVDYSALFTDRRAARRRVA